MAGSHHNHIVIAPEVLDALRQGGPIVALETAVVTCGLPREPMPAPMFDCDAVVERSLHAWSNEQPCNLETACAMQRIIVDAGAVPAIVAVRGGSMHIGLADDALSLLATNEHAEKASITTLATHMACGRDAGTTVSATLAACRIAGDALDRKPISVFATGGIGGVHQGWNKTPDISADLRELAQTPTCVVSAGVKSLLDVPATLEALEALGVPTLSMGCDAFPRFYTPGDNHTRASARVDTSAQVAHVCQLHWSALGCNGGILLANPLPGELAVSSDLAERATAQAEASAREQQATGPERTPFVLAEVARLTDGRSLRANIALLMNNARLAAQIAIDLSR